MLLNLASLRLMAASCLLLGLTACGGDDDDNPGQFPDDTTCAISVSVSGAISDQVSGQEGVICGSGLSSSNGIEVGFAALEPHALRVFGLRVAEITRGQTGTSFSARVTLAKRGDNTRLWRAEECSVDVTSHTDEGQAELGRSFRMQGQGRCSGPAVDGSATEVHIDPFAFVVTVAWVGSASDAGS
jgi:hypothetical protein